MIINQFLWILKKNVMNPFKTHINPYKTLINPCKNPTNPYTPMNEPPWKFPSGGSPIRRSIFQGLTFNGETIRMLLMRPLATDAGEDSGTRLVAVNGKSWWWMVGECWVNGGLTVVNWWLNGGLTVVNWWLMLVGGWIDVELVDDHGVGLWLMMGAGE